MNAPFARRYHPLSIALHWLIALAIVVNFSLGWWMHDLPFSPQKLHYYAWHKWAGVCIFVLALVRLGWRWVQVPPSPAPGTPLWQRRAAHLTHLTLYGLMLAVPLSGWLMSSAKGVSVVLFGLWPLPDLVARDRALGAQLLVLHQTLNYGMALLLLAHAGAAIFHHFVLRDGVLRGMLPRLFWRKS